jgi:hypothetical protein|tara:strand:+ start:117 stop:362 length:246 start_codon:yes stop_codon:yes gene_type:complete
MYYILYPGNDESDTVNDINQLGEDNGFGVFWSYKGFELLMKAVDNNHFLLGSFVIMDERGKKYSIEEFLDKIKKLKVRIQN